jgi:hypothetical protein
LRIGWTLAAAARTRDGMLIVPAGTQISPMFMEKLRNFADLGDLEEPMLVLVIHAPAPGKRWTFPHSRF